MGRRIFWGEGICIGCLYVLDQGSPTPGPQTGIGPWPVRNWATQQEVSGGKLHLYLQPLAIAHITAWAPPPVRSVTVSDSHRSATPTVNCACEGSRLRASYENLMPDDMKWSRGGDASAGEWLQIQIIISREVCTETIINPLLADSYQNPISGGFPGGAVVENLPANAGDTGSSPGVGRSHMPRSN